MRRVVRGQPIVRVAYIPEGRSFDPRPKIRDESAGYAFIWPFEPAPTLGALAVEHTGQQVCVIGFGTEYQGNLETLTRLLPGNALSNAESADQQRIADARRVLSGEKVQGVPPVDGTARSAADANANGSWWWRTAAAAAKAGAPDAAEFKRVARHWYKVRDAAREDVEQSIPAGRTSASSATSTRPAPRPVAAWKVVLGICTCGLSLPFTGVRVRR